MKDDDSESRLSYFEGDRSEPLLECTVGAAFDGVVAEHGGRLALVVRHQGVRWIYRDLAERVSRVAAGLWNVGLRPGDRIGLWAMNCAEWTLTQYASAKLGLVLVNLNPAYRADEIDYALAKVGCKALVFQDRFKSTHYLEMLRSIAPELDSATPGCLHAKRLPDLRCLIQIGQEKAAGVFDFAEIDRIGAELMDDGFNEWPGDLRPGDPANIQFTSGTTGRPKAATLSHRGLLNNAWFTGRICGTSARDTICVPLPLFHIFGMLTGNLLAMLRGATIVHPGEAFDPDAVLDAVEEERCTSLYGVPTMFVSELASQRSRSRDLASLRTGIIAGSVVPMELLRRVMADMNMAGVVNGYGMTETSSAIMVTSPTDTPERRVTSVGRVVPHVDVRIVDSDGAIVPIGHVGEIQVRGYSVMLGYWEDYERTSETIGPDGWLRTGDLGVFDEEGYGRIAGRIKELVIRGGENISCGEIEEFLTEHPDIESACVVGIPDEKYGEELCACVKAKPGRAIHEDDVRAFCRERLAHFKVPRYVRFLDDFPMTSSGKVQKFLLARSSVEALGLSRAS